MNGGRSIVHLIAFRGLLCLCVMSLAETFVTRMRRMLPDNQPPREKASIGESRYKIETASERESLRQDLWHPRKKRKEKIT
jgi:hypothetical protein